MAIDETEALRQRNEHLAKIREKYGRDAEQMAFTACECAVASFRVLGRAVKGISVPGPGHVRLQNGELTFTPKVEP